MKKNLPIGIQTFDKIIAGNYVYVDKTQLLYELAITDKPYFLARPRRFGKSLTISTLEAIFQGKRDLFKGLAIDQTDYDWTAYPILRFDMGIFKSSSPLDLEKDIESALNLHARNNQAIDLSLCSSITSKFSELIERLAAQSEHKKIVILIDEYDKPIMDQITNKEVARANREVLKLFYTTLKSSDAHIRFCFITGITKFTQTSIFSGLNNLDDLTVDERAATLCGYTQEELEQSFKGNHLAALALKLKVDQPSLLAEIKYWYNGYRFTFNDECKRVYNPFSILHLFQKNEFRDYWFKSGTPTFLINLLKEKFYPIEETHSASVADSDIDSFDIDTIKLPILLFQTGYLTIRTYDSSTKNLTLQFPNHEVESAFLSHVISELGQIERSLTNTCTIALQQALRDGNLDSVIAILYRFFSGIPYSLHIELERYYQTLFYCICDLAGFMPLAEVQTNVGRTDMLLETAQQFYIFELKINRPAQEALEQIIEKKYYERYLGRGKPVVLVGMSFDTKLRNINKSLAIQVLT